MTVTDQRAADATRRLFALLPARIRDRDAREGQGLAGLFQVLGRASAELDAERATARKGGGWHRRRAGR